MGAACKSVGPSLSGKVVDCGEPFADDEQLSPTGDAAD
jgi:hypothetical protein